MSGPRSRILHTVFGLWVFGLINLGLLLAQRLREVRPHPPPKPRYWMAQHEWWVFTLRRRDPHCFACTMQSGALFIFFAHLYHRSPDSSCILLSRGEKHLSAAVLQLFAPEIPREPEQTQTQMSYRLIHIFLSHVLNSVKVPTKLIFRNIDRVVPWLRLASSKAKDNVSKRIVIFAFNSQFFTPKVSVKRASKLFSHLYVIDDKCLRKTVSIFVPGLWRRSCRRASKVGRLTGHEMLLLVSDPDGSGRNWKKSRTTLYCTLAKNTFLFYHRCPGYKMPAHVLQAFPIVVPEN
jgi:hypothetical protein